MTLPTAVHRIIAALMALVVTLAPLRPAFAGDDDNIPIIRDAEIESLLRLYTKPIFLAAGINPGAVQVFLIKDNRINAFVAGGQRIFINTGTLLQAQTPNEVIGVLAHESGHIAGGHLARLGIELSRESNVAIIGMLMGAAAMVGGAVAGNSNAAQAGGGLMMGSQSLAQRNVLSYQRAMEASADQAALKFLNATHQSAKGMLRLFNKLASESIATVRSVDPYLQSHPMPFDRIRTLEEAAKKSPYWNTPDSAALVFRHQLMQAKLIGFLEPASTVYQKYPMSNNSIPARYARSIAMFRKGDTKNAVPIIEGLTRELPQDPYFWELLGQALLEGGQPAAAVPPLRKAVSMLPNGLLQILLAQALIATESREANAEALKMLRLAQRTESENADLFQYMGLAYGQSGDTARAELATAEFAWRTGDKKLLLQKAKSAQSMLPKNSPEWLRANDLLTIAGRD